MRGELIALAVHCDVLSLRCRCCGASAAVELVEGRATPPLRQHAAGCPVPLVYAALAAGDRATARAQLALAAQLAQLTGASCAS